MNYIAETSLGGNLLETVQGWLNIVTSLPGGKIIGAILVFIIGRWIAKLIAKLVKKLLGATSIDNKLERYVGSKGTSIESTIAGLVYSIALLFVAILALNTLGLTDAAKSLQGLFEKFTGAIPNIVMAGILLYIGYFVGGIVKQLIENVLSAARVDERLGNGESTPVATALSTVGFFFIVLMFLTPALEALKIEAISEPLSGIVGTIMDAIPNLFLAGILLAIGCFIAKIAGTLVQNLLTAVGIDAFPEKIGLTGIPSSGGNSVSGVASKIVSLSIIVLLASTAINVLNIELLQKASEGLVGGYFNLLLAVILLGAGILAAKFVYENLADKNLCLAKIARIAIITIVSVVALERSGLDGGLLNGVFKYLVIAACFAGGVGGAIALGLGGKDYVNRWFDKKG